LPWKRVRPVNGTLFGQGISHQAFADLLCRTQIKPAEKK
jgi:hypothetical protein